MSNGIIQVGKWSLNPTDLLDADPRGLIWIWEMPRASANYVIACDPSYGIPQWQRELRTENDEKTDNCAIEVIRCGTRGSPDIQVAEYAAPIDAEDAAAVVNFLGRMYGGASEEEQALAIIEVQPGPGLLTQRELINRFGYNNLYVWQHLDQMVMKPTLSYGWFSSRQSRQALWIRGTRYINNHKIKLNSPWLVEEMTDCVLDNFLSFTARAQWGAHDDRIVALLMAIWAANEWSFENAPEEAAKPTITGNASWQSSDLTSEEMQDEWNERIAALSGDL
jgi:hypothetical protein